MKHKKSTKNLFWIFILLVALASIVIFCYKQPDDNKSQNLDFISDGIKRNLLISTQRSQFKDSIIAVVSEH